jgi:hypothetical protein
MNGSHRLFPQTEICFLSWETVFPLFPRTSLAGRPGITPTAQETKPFETESLGIHQEGIAAPCGPASGIWHGDCCFTNSLTRFIFPDMLYF